MSVTHLSGKTEAEVRAALAKVCSAVGLDAANAKLLGRSVNAVFLLRSAPVVVRLRHGGTRVIERSLQLARWLAEHNAPTIRLVDHCEQMVGAEGYCATFWEAGQRKKERWQGADFALPLLELHQLTPPPSLPEWDPFEKIRYHVARAGWLEDGDRAWLVDECARLEQAFNDVKPSLRFGLIHADVKAGNFLRDASGRVVLCDLDDMARGPIVYDLVPTAVDAFRWGRALRHVTLAYAYGLDVTGEPAWPLLRRIREVKATATVLARSGGRLEAAAKAVHRLQTLRINDETARWYR